MALDLPTSRPCQIIAHRGASHDAPENTQEAILLAWRQSADASEFDVHQCRDGTIVLLHDPDTQRTAGNSGAVANLTIEQLRKLDVGRWKHERFTGEKIPTLTDILDTVPQGKRVFIEVKSGHEIVPELDRVLRKAQLPPDSTRIISFRPEVVLAVKQTRPDLLVYWLVDLYRIHGQKPPTAESLIRRARALGADGLDLSASPILDANFAAKVKGDNLGLYVYTVNELAEAQRLVAIGVDGITTDRPGWLREQLGLDSIP